MQIIKSFIREDDGAEMAEYALLVVILAIAVLTAGPALVKGLSDAFTNTGTRAGQHATTVSTAGNPPAGGS